MVIGRFNLFGASVSSGVKKITRWRKKGKSASVVRRNEQLTEFLFIERLIRGENFMVKSKEVYFHPLPLFFLGTVIDKLSPPAKRSGD